MLAAALTVPVSSARAQQPATAGQNATSGGASQATDSGAQVGSEAKKDEDKEPEDEKEPYRVSDTTRRLARMLHISPARAADIFEVLNFGVLFVALAWLLAKFLPKMFRNRGARIQRQLEEARQSTEESRRRLSEIEERLSKLDDEIIRLHAQSERDMQGEEERFRAMMESEKEKIIDSAEQEITAAGAQARRELKQLAAELAVGRAEQKLQLTDDMDGKLIGRFAQTLGDKN
jgi:F-type H+-transporting ATPase subunit b